MVSVNISYYNYPKDLLLLVARFMIRNTGTFIYLINYVNVLLGKYFRIENTAIKRTSLSHN